jgi:hypothetical protein
MKKKKVKCRHCGVRFRAREVRCPACQYPNPVRVDSGVSSTDRVVGAILVGIGVLIGIPALWLLIWTLLYGGVRGKAACAILVIVPVGSVFHGVLLLCGIHPRDFYAWFNSLSPINRALLCGVLGIAVVGLLFLVFFSNSSGGGRPDFEPDFD